MTALRARLEDELAQVVQDLFELDDQVALGEIDEATARRMRTTYEQEAERLRAELELPTVDEPAPGRSRHRMVAGGLVLGIGVIVIVVTAVISLTNRPPGGNVTGGVASEVLAGEGVDLDQISNEEMEAVVAANPNVVPMRLALARRYFEAAEYGKALDHYMVLLDDQGVQSPEALANVGWMTAASGRPDVGVTFVERALEIDPDYVPAYWYLANMAFVLDDRAGATSVLERLLTYPDLPVEVESQARSMLEELRAGP